MRRIDDGYNTVYGMNKFEPTGYSIIDNSLGNDFLIGEYGQEYSLFIDLRPGQYSELGSYRYGCMSRRSTFFGAIGGQGDDTLIGNDYRNHLDGREGRDTIFGEGGNDFIEGWNDADVLVGGDGDDVLRGGHGVDTIYGGPGNDQIYGGISGGDRLVGGEGFRQLRLRDALWFLGQRLVPCVGRFESPRGDPDIIYGFDGPGAAQGDMIDLSPINANRDQDHTSFNPYLLYEGFHFNKSTQIEQLPRHTLLLDERGDYTVIFGITHTELDFEILIADGATRHTAYTVDDFYL